jgi:hypothetical protein
MLAEGDLLTAQEVLRILPIGRSTLYALCKCGQLPHYRVRAAASRRGRLLVARADLEAFVAGSRQAAPRAPTRADVDKLLERVRGKCG